MLFSVNLQALEKVGSERHQLGRGVRADDPEITDARLFQEVADLSPNCHREGSRRPTAGA
jgi:hypothetical protein